MMIIQKLCVVAIAALSLLPSRTLAQEEDRDGQVYPGSYGFFCVGSSGNNLSIA